MMLITPRPVMPYWPAYPEPERSALEAAYRAEEAKWQRETQITLALNCVWPLLMVAAVCAAAFATAFVVPDAIMVLAN